MRSCILIALSVVAVLRAQQASTLADARAMDKEIQKLPNLPEAKRDAAFREMLHRIRSEPKQYRLALASNLAVSAGEVATESATLQETPIFWSTNCWEARKGRGLSTYEPCGICVLQPHPSFA